MADTKIEYRVKRITRYVITKHEESLCGRTGSTIEKGTYDNADIAYEVAYALCKQDHERLGYGPGDERIIYPHPINDVIGTDALDKRPGVAPGARSQIEKSLA